MSTLKDTSQLNTSKYEMSLLLIFKAIDELMAETTENAKAA